ncbi:MAG: cryptochrome/photolyase family protein [Gammaproteobacteria bacterium]
MTTLFPLLGTHLFPPATFADVSDTTFLMVEDRALCSYLPFHQHKLVLVLAAMRHQADALRAAGHAVHYLRLDEVDNDGLFAAIARELAHGTYARVRHFPPPGRHAAALLERAFAAAEVTVEPLPGPQFLTALDEFDAHLRRGKPFLARFYRAVRERHGILLDADGGPRGGRWSFDADNRRALPREVTPPDWPAVERDAHVSDCIALVAREFAAHPGVAHEFAWPVTRQGALAWLDDFLDARFAAFGTYQDAITTRSPLVFHSALSPFLNLGLLTPHEVLERALRHAAAHEVPLNSLEGFVRQLAGWREFVRGVHARFGADEARANHFDHQRRPAPSWYAGDTGIPPLDTAIRGACARGWNHHIERLMVLGNLMLLAEIAPRHAYAWFMSMYVDAYQWVMEPNVYGMALFSDGGLFATKPYVCGANYLLRMSDHPRGQWCDVVDGLYWRFCARQRAFFERQPRLRVMTGNLDRMDSTRRERIFAAAEAFLATHTIAADGAAGSA